jgi:DNA excision repair protein ERCC-4
VSRSEIIKQKVIVDVREFRSQLPGILHKRGIELEAETIEIGDYVLTSDICVERKSLIDLIGSLSSGRLYNQTRMMIRFYRKSILLIEFDERQDFGLKGKMSFQWKGFAQDSVDTTRKLVLLTISFPKLRMIWSPSPSFSAEMFELLKMDKDQPDVNRTLDISKEELPVEELSDTFDIEAKDFLLSLPGVNYHNVFSLMRKFTNIFEILKASKDELIRVLDSKSNGNSLFKCLHEDLANYCVNNEIKMNKTKPKHQKSNQQKRARKTK